MAERVVAIDGPAGSGKSTTAKAVASALGLAHLDSGGLYRALTVAALDTATPLEDEALTRLAADAPVTLGIRSGAFYPAVGSEDVSSRVRGEAVTTHVPLVASLPRVRVWATEQLREAASRHPRGVVCDGRDIGTVVFPDAAVKVFLTASVTERARRRALESYGSATNEQIERQRHDITDRDRVDSTREVSPLRKPHDAVEVDTSNLSFEEQVRRIIELVRKAF